MSVTTDLTKHFRRAPNPVDNLNFYRPCVFHSYNRRSTGSRINKTQKNFSAANRCKKYLGISTTKCWLYRWRRQQQYGVEENILTQIFIQRNPINIQNEWLETRDNQNSINSREEIRRKRSHNIMTFLVIPVIKCFFNLKLKQQPRFLKSNLQFTYRVTSL